MLLNRRISGRYEWRDGTEFGYVGSYEKDFLRFMDQELNWVSSDMPKTMINTLNPCLKKKD